MGTLSILNTGHGDNCITIGDNPADKIRAARIINDMLRRGYALIVEVERDGVKAFERVKEFDEKHCQYIIADFDNSQQEERNGEATTTETAPAGDSEPPRKKAGRPRKIGATEATAHAVGRSAGG